MYSADAIYTEFNVPNCLVNKNYTFYKCLGFDGSTFSPGAFADSIVFEVNSVEK